MRSAGAVKGKLDVAQVERLAEEFDDIEMNCLPRGFEITEGGQNHGLRFRPACADALEQFHPAHAGQLQIEQEDVMRLSLHDRQRRLGRCDRGDGKAKLGNNLFQQARSRRSSSTTRTRRLSA